MNLPNRVADRPVAVLAWAVAILLAGTWALTKVPVEWVPRVELPEVNISAVWAEGSPRQVERYVTAPIERAVLAVPGVESVSSYSQEGVSTVTLQASQSVDFSIFVAEVNEQLQLVSGALPERVFARLTKQIPEELREQLGFMQVQLSGPQSADILRALAVDVVKPLLGSVPGVGAVRVEGGTEREVRVTLDPDRMSSFSLDPSDVRSAIADVSRDLTYGRYREPRRSVLMFSSPESSVEALALVPVKSRSPPGAPILMRDVADVELTEAPLRSLSRIDGQPVVSITIDRARGSDMLEVAAAVRDRLTSLGSSLPESVRLVVAVDRSQSVREQFDALLLQGGMGMLLVLLVLMSMLKSVRATAVVIFAVAVAAAVACLLFLPLKLSLNMITVAGLVLVFGLLVDNAVVVVEQLMQRRSVGESLPAVWLPLVGGTLTTITVLFPLAYLSGELRRLFVPFGVLAGVTLLSSLVTAAVVLPVTKRFLPRHEAAAGGAGRWLRRVVAKPYALAAQCPRLTIILFALLIGLPFWKMPTHIVPPADGARPRPIERLVSLYNGVQQKSVVIVARELLDPAIGGVLRRFFRETTFGSPWVFDRQQEVTVRLGFPPGNPVARADSLISPFEAIALASPSTKQTIVRATNRSASLQVAFHEASLMQAGPHIMRERLIQRAASIGGVSVSVSGLVSDGYYSGYSGSSSGQSLMAYGANYEDLEELTERFAAFLKRRSRRVREVNTNTNRRHFDGRNERLVVAMDWYAEEQVQSGATAQEIAERLRPVLSAGLPSFSLPIDSHEFHTGPVGGRIVVRDAERMQLDQLTARPITLGDSARVQLAAYTSPALVMRPSAIEREGQQYKRHIAVDYVGPYRVANKFIEESIAAFPVPSGYRIEHAQFSFLTDQSRRSLLWMIAGTILIVFLITATVFESWRLPVLVLLSVPTSLVGVALLFIWTGASFSQGAFIGSVLLVGVAANDMILLTYRYDQLRRRHPARVAVLLIRLAVRERLRPMWTTTLTSAATMAPMIVLASDSDFWLGLALVVTGGLVSSTLLGPVVTVALVAASPRRHQR